jgi:hypothetical protein
MYRTEACSCIVGRWAFKVSSKRVSKVFSVAGSVTLGRLKRRRMQTEERDQCTPQVLLVSVNRTVATKVFKFELFSESRLELVVFSNCQLLHFLIVKLYR